MTGRIGSRASLANRVACPRVDRLPVYRYGGLLHVNRANYHVLLILLFRQTFNRMAGEEPELSREEPRERRALNGLPRAPRCPLSASTAHRLSTISSRSTCSTSCRCPSSSSLTAGASCAPGCCPTRPSSGVEARKHSRRPWTASSMTSCSPTHPRTTAAP